MRYPKLSEFLNARQLEMCNERRRIVRQIDLARETNTSAKSMSRWFDGMSMPEPEYWPDLARVFGNGFYEAIDQPKPMPRQIDPKLQWMLDNQNDPNVREYLEELKLEGEKQLRTPDRIIRISSASRVTP